MDVGGPTQRERDHSARHGVIAQAVDQDKTAHIAIFGIRIERDRAIKRDIAETDLVEIEMLGGNVLVRPDVDFVLQLGDASAHQRWCRRPVGTSDPATSLDRSSR